MPVLSHVVRSASLPCLAAGVLTVGLLACGDDPTPPPQRVPARLEIVAGDDQTAPAGSPVPVAPTVRLLDANGDPVAGYNIGFATSTGSVSPGVSTTDANGLAQTSWTLRPEAGMPNAMEARAFADGVSPARLTFTATSTAASATRLFTLSGDNQTATPGTAVGLPVVVAVVDAGGNRVAGAQVRFTVIGGGGSVAAGDVLSDANGEATPGAWTLGAVRGLNELQVTLVGMSGAAPDTLFASAATYSPDVRVRVTEPVMGSVVRDTVFLRVASLVGYFPTQVEASVADRQVALGNGMPGWIGKLPLNGLPRGDLFITVTGQNAAGARTETLVRVFYEPGNPAATAIRARLGREPRSASARAGKHGV